MNRSAPVFLIAVVLLVTASCSSTPHNLEKLDLSPTKSTDNLVIEARSLGNSGLSTAGIVKGAGEGALTGLAFMLSRLSFLAAEVAVIHSLVLFWLRFG